MSSHESAVDSEPTHLESTENTTNTPSIENTPLEEAVRQGPKYTINLTSGFMKHIERHQEKRKHVEVEWKEKMSDPKRQEEVDARIKMHQAHTAKLSEAESLKPNKAPSRLAVAALRATTSRSLKEKRTRSTPNVSTTTTPTPPPPTTTTTTLTTMPTSAPIPLSTPTPTHDAETTALPTQPAKVPQSSPQTTIPTPIADTPDNTKEIDSNASILDTDKTTNDSNAPIPDTDSSTAIEIVSTASMPDTDNTTIEIDNNASMPDTDTVASERSTTKIADATPLQNNSVTTGGDDGRFAEDGKRVRRPRRTREGKRQTRDTPSSTVTTHTLPTSTTNDEEEYVQSKSTASAATSYEPQPRKPWTKFSSRSKRPKIVAPPGRWSSQWWYDGEDGDNCDNVQTKDYLKLSMAAMELVYEDQVSFKTSEEKFSCVIDIGDRTVKTKEFASQDLAEMDAVMRCCAILDSRSRLFKSKSEADNATSIQNEAPPFSRSDRRRHPETSQPERGVNMERGDATTKRPSTQTKASTRTSDTHDPKEKKEFARTRDRDRRRGDGHPTNAHVRSDRNSTTSTYTSTHHNPNTNTNTRTHTNPTASTRNNPNTNNTTTTNIHTNTNTNANANTNRPPGVHNTKGNRNQQHADRDEKPHRERRERRPERELRKPSRCQGQKATSNNTTPNQTLHEQQNQLETNLEHLKLGKEKERQRLPRNAQIIAKGNRSTRVTTNEHVAESKPPTTTTTTTTTTSAEHTAPLTLNQRRPRQAVQHYVPRMRQKRPEPLCKFDVEMKNGQKHQLIICEGDNAEKMTRVFGETHHMEGDHVETLLGYVTQELASKTLVTTSTA